MPFHYPSILCLIHILSALSKLYTLALASSISILYWALSISSSIVIKHSTFSYFPISIILLAALFQGIQIFFGIAFGYLHCVHTRHQVSSHESANCIVLIYMLFSA
ncbi:hypothetical protein M405DRAFT_207676 [Rhizopogon salebrosus TDB-379]|nr:hypothetical protein M405DRAFT_207676 [Rhizopogon salebrosus TDB-379]